MRTVIQRVAHASVAVPEEGYGTGIGKGLLVLAAFIDEDTDEDIEWTARKIAAMRIFDDADGVMNLSVKDVEGEILAKLVDNSSSNASITSFPSVIALCAICRASLSNFTRCASP